MKLVPTYRLLLFAGVIILPLTLLLPVVDAAIVAAIGLTVAVLAVALTDAYRSKGRLQGIRVELPEVVRISKGREGNFNLQIENEESSVRRIRLGLAFPEEIYSPAVELSVELPEDNPLSSIVWLLKGLKQGRYPVERCYLEAASLWGFWSIRTALPINMEIRVYPNLFEE
ncbi:MAG: hypothetical protein P8X80_11190 [Desulfobacterales bacterium]